jgi:hypothetical protein
MFQQPLLEALAAGIKVGLGPEDVLEKTLHNRFRIAIMKSVADNARKHSTMSLIKHCEGIIATAAQGSHQLCIAECMQLRVATQKGFQFAIG